MSLEAALRASWDGRAEGMARLLPVVTTPLSAVWRVATAARNLRWDHRPARPVRGLRVVSVGNLAVGGTGKTPMTRWVVERLRERTVRCAVVLSGYGEDEVRLHRRWHPDLPVYAGRDRRALLQKARDEGAQVAVLDDAFQHRRAPRDLDLVLVAAEHPFPDRLLPRGRYREPPGALERADLVVVTRRRASVHEARDRAERAAPFAGSAPCACAVLAPDGWQDVSGAAADPPAGELLAVASVADPDAFAASVRSLVPGTVVRLRGFPDHHAYSEQDVRGIVDEARGGTLVTTEKDAVKLARFDTVPDATRVLAARIRWDWGEDRVLAALDRLVGDVR